MTDRDLKTLLDQFVAAATSGNTAEGISALVPGLTAFRRTRDRDSWRRIVAETVLPHRATEFIHQDPFTAHSFRKPRGYAGDAALLDLIYDRAAPHGTTDHGKAIFQYTINAPEPSAVRERRDILARRIDEAARRVQDPRILSIACGHLREAELSESVMAGRFRGPQARFWCLDQDLASIRHVVDRVGRHGVVGIEMSIRGVLSRKTGVSQLDLVYAAGLFDYLEDRVAARLLREMFNLLRSGGRILVANFAPHGFSQGYMESYMDWSLIYRDESEMRGLLSELPASELLDVSAWRGANGHVVYLEGTRL